MELSITNGRRTRSERGFSLLSTLLAVMILAVILAIAVPRFSSALATANTVKVQADLTALDTAIVLYQTAKGKNPEGIDDLKDYVTDLKHLKPPAGTVHAGAQELSMENVSYQVEKKDGVWRAAGAGRTAEEYHTRHKDKVGLTGLLG